MKIHIWDNPSGHTDERAVFRSKCREEFGIDTSISIDDLTEVDVVFAHGGDSYLLPRRLENILVVIFGNDRSIANPIEAGTSRVSYINARELADRFPVILKRIRDTNSLTITALHEIIFGPDDPGDAEIENLLADVCKKLPFADSWNTELRNKRHRLIKIIEEKHGIQLT